MGKEEVRKVERKKRKGEESDWESDLVHARWAVTVSQGTLSV